MTFKDLKKRVSLELPQQQFWFFERLQNKPFWIWNMEKHKHEDIKTNGYCCFNHIIGLPQKEGDDKPLYDYEQLVYDSLIGNAASASKHLWNMTSPELIPGPVPDPLCIKNPNDILCQVDCTTNPDDPSCKPALAPELANSTSTAAAPQEFSFKETLEVSPDLKGVIISGPTNKFVDSIGTMHIVGELRNDGTKTLNVGQIAATIYGPNNRTLGLDYATPTPATLSPGQSGTFEFFVGGDQPSDGVNDLSQITRVKYHVGF